MMKRAHFTSLVSLFYVSIQCVVTTHGAVPERVLGDASHAAGSKCAPIPNDHKVGKAGLACHYSHWHPTEGMMHLWHPAFANLNELGPLIILVCERL